MAKSIADVGRVGPELRYINRVGIFERDRRERVFAEKARLKAAEAQRKRDRQSRSIEDY